MQLDEQQLTGRSDSHIEYDAAGLGLRADCRRALTRLAGAARARGFELRVASGFRSFERQLAIWNGKVRGARSVHDDQGRLLELAALTDIRKIHAILRYSALPGASRHHWGTDLDIYDAAAIPTAYTPQLIPQEIADDGMFGPFHRWLDERMAAGEAEGFYRPYQTDAGGVAPERWHISYAPVATACAAAYSEVLLERTLRSSELALLDAVLEELPALYRRYVLAPVPGIF